jgi:putative transposase
MTIDQPLLDQLLAGREPQGLFAKGGLIDDLKKALSERMLAAELDDDLETEAEAGIGNRCNGSSKKTMLIGSSKLTLDILRDRLDTFDPKLIAKYQRQQLYGTDVSPDLISTVTDAVLEAVTE